jgi:cobalt/nickel transport system ATP-binding protein
MRMLNVDQLSYTYPDGTRALDAVSFSVDANDVVGIAGSNGAGKTTLINHLCGYILPHNGTIEIAGVSVTKKNIDAVRKAVGVLFQNTDDQLFMPSVIEDVAFGIRSQGCTREEAFRRALRQLEALELAGLRDKPPFHLSQGQKRFVAFAGILAMKPQLILMDEPTSDLDPRHRRMLIGLVNSLSSTTRIIVSHDLDFLWDTCTRVILMNGGRIVRDGAVKELLACETLLVENGLELPLRLQG